MWSVAVFSFRFNVLSFVFTAKMTFTWSKDLEKALLELWHVVGKRFDKKMKTAKEKREWVRKRLIEMKAEGTIHIAPGAGDVDDLTDEIVKNKIDGLKRTGRKNMDKFVVPALKRI